MKFLRVHSRDIFIIISIVLGSTLLLYVPFLTNTLSYLGFSVKQEGMKYLYQNYDGLLYLIPAKTWYNPELIKKLPLEQGLGPLYYAAHLPLYPFLIALVAPVLGYLKSMLFVSIVGSVILAVAFYFVLKKLDLSHNPLILTTVFLFLPRFLVVRSVGAPESWFLFLIIMSLYFWEKKTYWLAGLFGGLATMTKTPGILLFAAYFLSAFESYRKTKKFQWSWLWMGLVPLGLILVFSLYALEYGDFFAYFHTGGVVPMIFPFSVFNFQAKWVGTAWLEEILFYFFVYGLTVYSLKDFQYRSFFYFALFFLLAATTVQHRDLSRYLLPLWPLACIAFERFLTSRKVTTVGLLLLPAVFLYAWNFLLFNILPISDWTAFIK